MTQICGEERRIVGGAPERSQLDPPALCDADVDRVQAARAGDPHSRIGRVEVQRQMRLRRRELRQRAEHVWQVPLVRRQQRADELGWVLRWTSDQGLPDRLGQLASGHLDAGVRDAQARRDQRERSRVSRNDSPR